MGSGKGLYNEEGDITDIQRLKNLNDMEKYLETDLNMIKFLIEASDDCLVTRNIEDLIDVIQKCSQHMNKHLREVN